MRHLVQYFLKLGCSTFKMLMNQLNGSIMVIYSLSKYLRRARTVLSKYIQYACMSQVRELSRQYLIHVSCGTFYETNLESYDFLFIDMVM